ncbi:hypothetical protein GUITHDRAFT_131446 [Guillardia theta CCMP2712]|uniref:RAP domain-containing protein n=1 Tax=Guillardia theta (strain CCMP2712) TaxID=905079 RepID=L1K2Y0_GUITC|nr:hypothetical protein GUITHDRAFT_131446 [Guillardia theta CCMP2712]EKX55186.1 hypothetical protein GUITHDRAFT_131446 [Guillardia theta CCMP2712]|eukprot:XP_005842166.1 hypothetical protein GUITHDRAFT_131446 [Guillardia theta CCMP2712]
MSHLLLLLLAIMSILPVMLTPVDSREAFVGHASFFRRRHEARGCLRERARLRCLRRDHRRLVCMQRTDAGQSSPSSASGDGTASDEESCEVDGQEAAGPDAAWWEKMEEDNEMLDGNLEASSVKLLKDVSEDFLSKLPISRLLTTLIKPEDPVVVPAVGNVSSEYSEEEDGTARVEEDSPARKGDYSESLDPGTGTFSALGSEILVSTLTSSVSKKPERQSIPKILLYCSNITDLLEELETICTVEEGGAGKREGAAWMKFQEVLKPEDAVLALNHIKRLEGQVGIDSIALNERKNRMFDHLAAQICKEMSALGPKHVALAATAVATRRRREEMMRAVTRRLLEMQADPVREFVFTEQTIAMLFNAFAKERRSEEQALSMLSSLVLNLSGGMKSLQNVAIILNSMASGKTSSNISLRILNVAIRRLSRLSVLNAAVRLDVSNENFFRFMSSYVKPSIFTCLASEILSSARSFDRWEEQIMCRIGRNRVKPVRSSELQRSVGAAAALLGLEVEEEVVEEDTGLSVDFFLPSLSLYIEVDGPFHYAVDLAEEEVDAGGGGDRKETSSGKHDIQAEIARALPQGRQR